MYVCHYMHTQSTSIYVCMLQNGLQPIHYAAQEGREDIVMILVDDFNVKPDVVTFVWLCIQLMYKNVIYELVWY